MPFLDTQAENAVRQRAAALEAATGVEAVVAVVARADSYPEIPWKAFALGVSLAALAATAAALLEPGWEAARSIVETTVITLAAGAAAALATIRVAPFARLFLPRHRREMEVQQYAQAMFLDSGLAGSTRGGMLLLVSLFERQAIVIADPRTREAIGASGLDAIVSAVATRLARASLQDALHDGLAKLEETLVARGFRGRPGDTNEITDAVIQRRGTV
jgi:putative membrane protein